MTQITPGIWLTDFLTQRKSQGKCSRVSRASQNQTAFSNKTNSSFIFGCPNLGLLNENGFRCPVS